PRGPSSSPAGEAAEVVIGGRQLVEQLVVAGAGAGVAGQLGRGRAVADCGLLLALEPGLELGHGQRAIGLVDAVVEGLEAARGSIGPPLAVRGPGGVFGLAAHDRVSDWPRRSASRLPSASWWSRSARDPPSRPP